MFTNYFKTFMDSFNPNLNTWNSIAENLQEVTEQIQELKYYSKHGTDMTFFNIDDSLSSDNISPSYFYTLQGEGRELKKVWFTKEQPVQDVIFSVILPGSNSAVNIVADLKFLPDRHQYELNVHSIEGDYKVHYWNPFEDICLVFKPNQKGCFFSSKDSIDLGINYLNYFYKDWKEEDYFKFSPGLRDTGYLHGYQDKEVYSCRYILKEDLKEGLLYFNKSFGVGGELLNHLPKNLEKDIECYRYNNPTNFDCLFTSDQKRIDFKTLEKTQIIDYYNSWCYKFTY